MKASMTMAAIFCVVIFPIAVLAKDQILLKDSRESVIRLREAKQSDSIHRSTRLAGDIFRGILEDETRPQCASMSLPKRPSTAQKTSAPLMLSDKPSTVPPMEAVTKPAVQLSSSPQQQPSTKAPSTPSIVSSGIPSTSPEGLSAPVEVQDKTNVPSLTTPSATTRPPKVPLVEPTIGSNDPSANPVSSQTPFDPSSKSSKPSENQSAAPSHPSVLPSVDESSAPSQPSSNDSTISPIFGSSIPSTHPNSSPREVIHSENGAFRCRSEESNGQTIAFTSISFNVSYQVESLAPLTEFLADMEAKIVEVALSGALQCNSRPLIPANITLANTVVTTTNFGDSCVAPVTSCLRLMTVFNATVNEDLDPDVAAFLGYILLREEMDGGKFSKEIQLIDNMKYTGPLPLLPPVANDDEVNQAPVQDIEASDRASVSPWALGAVSVASFGGLVVLIAWLRKKANQNRRHMELIEDMSVGSPSHA